MLSKTKAAYIVYSIILEAQIIRQKLELQGNRMEDDELNDFQSMFIEIYHCLADYNRTHHEPLSFERD